MSIADEYEPKDPFDWFKLVRCIGILVIGYACFRALPYIL